MASSPAEPSPKVFVSYSRRDMAFVDELDAALRARGIEPLIDRSEILAFEDWWRRIEDLIAQADTIVFVLSPDAVASDVCNREVAYAGQLNKRFAPVVARPVDPADVPEALRRLNFIFLDDPLDVEAGIEGLVEALGTDIDWVRRHSEFGEMARRWAQAGRPGPQGMLLRSPLLEEAERWIATRPGNAPPPTEATQTLILTSRRAATRRRTIVSAALAVGLAVALLLGGVAFWQRQVARQNERAAVTAREAETTARRAESEQRGLAEARERQAVEAANRTLAGQSLYLADAAARSLAESDSGTAVLLALEALPDRAGGVARPLVAQARQALDRGLAGLAERRIALRHAGFSLVFSADGRRVASQGGDETVVADAASGKILMRGEFGRRETVSFGLGASSNRAVHCSATEVQLVDLATSRRHRLDVGAGAMLGPLVACGFGPDDANILLADDAGRAAWWSGNDKQEPKLFDLPAGLTIFGLGARNATILAALDGTAQLREAATGRLVASMPGEGGEIEGIQLSRDGSRALIVERDRLRLWNVAAGTAATLAAPRKAVAQLGPDGGRLILRDAWPMNTRGGGFEVWDTESDRRLASVDKAAALVALAFGPDGRHLVAAGSDGSVRLFDAESGRELRRLVGHRGRGLAVAMSPDGRSILSSGFDTRLVLWGLDAARPSRRLDVASDKVTGAVPLADGGVLVAADGALRVWTSEPSVPSRGVADVGPAFVSLAPAPGGRRALATRRNGDGVLVDLVSGREVASFPSVFGAAAGGFADAVFSPDGTRLAMLADAGEVSIHDTGDGREVGRHPVSIQAPSGIAFAGEAHVLVWSARGDAALVDARTGGQRPSIRNVPLGPDGKPMPAGPEQLPWTVLRPSPDGRRLATWDVLQPRIWDLASGRLMHILQDHIITGAAGHIVFSSDGTTLYTTEQGRIVTAWEVETGRRIRSFSGHSAAVTTIRVSPDGRFLLTGSEDRTARIWDVASGIEIAALAGHDGAIRDARFGSQGREVVTASDDGSVRIWPFAPDVQDDVDRAKASMGRCLAPEQRRRFYLDPVPPDWCFIGPGLEAELDPAKWQPRAPYHMPLWQNWYRAKRDGRPTALPRID